MTTHALDARRAPDGVARRRAVLHVGTMKTGTTTLQDALARHPDVLQANGYRYPGWPMRNSRLLRRHLDSNLGLIVSDEGMWHFCASERSDTPEIAALLGEFDVTIVVYLRRPDEFVESWFSQGLKTGSGPPDLTTFLMSPVVNSKPVALRGKRRIWERADFLASIDLRLLKRLEYFRSCFPDADLIVRPFERSQLVGRDIVTDFIAAIGLENADALAVREADSNVSPGADTVLLASLLRRVHNVPDDEIDALLRTHAPPLSSTTARQRILWRHEAQAINDAMRPVFRKIQARYGGGATDDFFVDWDLDPEAFVTSEVRDLYDERIIGIGRAGQP